MHAVTLSSGSGFFTSRGRLSLHRSGRSAHTPSVVKEVSPAAPMSSRKYTHRLRIAAPTGRAMIPGARRRHSATRPRDQDAAIVKKAPNRILSRNHFGKPPILTGRTGLQAGPCFAAKSMGGDDDPLSETCPCWVAAFWGWPVLG